MRLVRVNAMGLNCCAYLKTCAERKGNSKVFSGDYVYCGMDRESVLRKDINPNAPIDMYSNCLGYLSSCCNECKFGGDEDE